MTERSMRDRVTLHEDIGAMEADFSGMHFATERGGRCVLRRGRQPPRGDRQALVFPHHLHGLRHRPRSVGPLRRSRQETPTSSTVSARCVSAPAPACARRSSSARSARCFARRSTTRAIRRSSHSAKCGNAARRWAGADRRRHRSRRRHLAHFRRREGARRHRLRRPSSARSARSSGRTAPARARC